MEAVDGSDPLAPLQTQMETKEEEEEEEEEDEEDGDDTDMDEWDPDPPRPFDPNDLCKHKWKRLAYRPLPVPVHLGFLFSHLVSRLFVSSVIITCTPNCIQKHVC